MTSPTYRLYSQANRFTCADAAADPAAAASVRDEFARWLRRNLDMDETRLCDVVLAVNEALANVAEFAYPDRGSSGIFDLDAVYDCAGAVLTVTICDQGHWRDSDPVGAARNRGRGIPLMRTLADSVIIDTSGPGTSVCLRFDLVHRAGAATTGAR